MLKFLGPAREASESVHSETNFSNRPHSTRDQPGLREADDRDSVKRSPWIGDNDAMTVNRATRGISEPTDITPIFTILARRWREETGHPSIVQQKMMNRSYLEIIGLGQPALPLSPKELRARPAHWFLALSSIARENPVRSGATFDEAVQDWLAWGHAQGLID